MPARTARMLGARMLVAPQQRMHTALGDDALPPLQTGRHTVKRVILLEQYILPCTRARHGCVWKSMMAQGASGVHFTGVGHGGPARAVLAGCAAE